MTALDQLPNDIDALKAMIIASEERNARKDVRIERLEKLLTDFKRALFGAKSEKAHPDQYHLALEDIETAMAALHAEDEAVDPRRQSQPIASRAVLCQNICHALKRSSNQTARHVPADMSAMSSAKM